MSSVSFCTFRKHYLLVQYVWVKSRQLGVRGFVSHGPATRIQYQIHLMRK